MITVANRIHVHPDYADAFEQRFMERAGLVDTMPGFLSNQVLRPTKAGEPYIVLTLWDSEEQFQAWIRSDAFQKGHATSSTLPREAFSGQSTIEIHEVISDSTRPELQASPRATQQ